MLCITSKQSDFIIVGDIVLLIKDIKGKNINLCIDADNNTNILRNDLIEDELKKEGYEFFGWKKDGNIKLYKRGYGSDSEIKDILTLIKELNIKERLIKCNIHKNN